MGLLFDARLRAIDANGGPISGATLTVYTAGTTTLADIYATSALDGGAALANPLAADAAGYFAQVFASDGEVVDLLVKDSGGVTLASYEDVSFLGAGTSLIERDFINTRLKISGSGGVVSIEAGDPAPDNTGGSLRLGGHAGTQADDISLDAALTTTTGAFTAGGPLRLSDGSLVTAEQAPLVVTGRYYGPENWLGGAASASATIGQIYYMPFNRAMTVDAIIIAIGSAQVGNVRLGLYASDPATGLPGALIEDTGATSTNTTGAVLVAFGSSHALTSRVWMAALFSVASSVSQTSTTSTGIFDPRILGLTGFGGSTIHGLYSTLAYGALPATAPAITGVLTQSVLMNLRAA